MLTAINNSIIYKCTLLHADLFFAIPLRGIKPYWFSPTNYVINIKNLSNQHFNLYRFITSIYLNTINFMIATMNLTKIVWIVYSYKTEGYIFVLILLNS